VLTAAGKNFIDATRTNPDAWEAALACVNYQVSLLPTPFLGDLNLHPPTYYALLGLEDQGRPRMRHYGNLPIADAAQAHPLFQSDANEGFQYGDAFLALDGGGMVLDEMRLKNVVMTGVQIVYEGGRTDLEAVYFINCKLAISNNTRGHQFAALILNSPLSVKFKTV